MAKFDLGLSWEEFEGCTPGMFQALAKRRNIRLKYERFANAQTAAAVYNVNRASVEDPMVNAYDFVMDDEEAARRDRDVKFKSHVTRVFGRLPMDMPMEKVLEVRRKVIADLAASGCKDAEHFVDGIFPHLKGK